MSELKLCYKNSNLEVNMLLKFVELLAVNLKHIKTYLTNGVILKV